MRDHPSPSPHPPPTQPAPERSNSNLSMMYYGMVVVGTAAIILALYNLLIVKYCLEFTDNESQQRARGQGRFDNFVSSFKYKRDGRAIDEDGESECAVCLSAYEEDEELKQLPRCKHVFHAPCIDMWLYSHVNCPLCRTPVVEPPVLHEVPVQRHDVVQQLEHSGEGLHGRQI